jgi:hypothetical protein
MISREFLQKRDREGYGPIVHRLGSRKQKSAIVRPIKSLERKDHLISNRFHESPEPRLCKGPVRGVRLVNRLPDVLNFDAIVLGIGFWMPIDQNVRYPHIAQMAKKSKGFVTHCKAPENKTKSILPLVAACVIVS